MILPPRPLDTEPAPPPMPPQRVPVVRLPGLRDALAELQAAAARCGLPSTIPPPTERSESDS